MRKFLIPRHMKIPVGVAVILGYNLAGHTIQVAGYDKPVVVPQHFFLKGTPSNGDYYLEYDDGRAIWISKADYLIGHEPLEEEQPIEELILAVENGMTFG